MAPKRKHVEDTRSPLEIAIAGTEEQIRQCEAQVQQFRDGVQDLAVHTAKIKTLETEIVPREAELKSILNNFNKLLDNSVVIARVRTSIDADVMPSSVSRQPSRAASRAGAGTPLPTSQPAEDAGDREALRHLSAVMREQLAAVVVPLFKHDRTQLEQQIDAAKAREAAEAQAAAAAAAAGATTSPTAPSPTAAKAPPKAPAPATAAAKMAASGADRSFTTASSAELLEKVDLELFRPPGLDPHLYTDVLKLRGQRLAAERLLKSLQQQLTHSRQLVARRNNEGASKSALKKAEKTLSALNATLRDLQKQRETQESRKKSETPQPQGKAGGKTSSVR
eukprot:CAMPEP_0174864100 /NCGR_PEP_ID=MMETSP1114-20130205/57713_1 /TAXON_ID=312471 /ORGANISM="Neobodo designis, Strain CCAP 1951/1" /LENGTH=336 /DNA_ID=CAMNT_0016099187 /DNA_START=80 /DNA_END=1087 /DNA_ORIENTATION=+